MPQPLPRTRIELRGLLESRGLRPQRRFGQNFLVDPQLADAIVADAGVGPRDAVIEIGPGAGALTQPLLERAGRVTAFELDHGLVALLEEHLGDHERFRLVAGDCLAGDGLAPAVLDALAAGPADGFDRTLVVANLPYGSGTQVVGRLLALDAPPTVIVAMLQAETFDRIRARVGGQDYGPLAVLAALSCAAALVRKVPPDVFVPRPKVESVVFRLTTRRPDGVDAATARRAAELAAAGFRQRRKRLGKALAGVVAAADLAAAGIDAGLRAEAVPPDAWVALARVVESR